MLWRVDAIIKHQLTVQAIHIIEEKLFIAHHAAVTHMQDQVITLPFKLGDHLTSAIYLYHTRFSQHHRVGKTAVDLRDKCSIIARDNIDAALIKLCHLYDPLHTS